MTAWRATIGLAYILTFLAYAYATLLTLVFLTVQSFFLTGVSFCMLVITPFVDQSTNPNWAYANNFIFEAALCLETYVTISYWGFMHPGGL